MDNPVVTNGDVRKGAGTIILTDVRARRGAILETGIIVSSAVPEYAIVAGNPAQLIKKEWDVSGGACCQ